MLSLIVAVVVVAGAVIVLMGERQADDAMADVRARASSTAVSGDDLLGAMFTADASIARRLGVDPAAVALSSTGTNRWCVQVTIRRMAAVREAHFSIEPGEALVPTSTC